MYVCARVSGRECPNLALLRSSSHLLRPPLPPPLPTAPPTPRAPPPSCYQAAARPLPSRCQAAVRPLPSRCQAAAKPLPGHAHTLRPHYSHSSLDQPPQVLPSPLHLSPRRLQRTSLRPEPSPTPAAPHSPPALLTALLIPPTASRPRLAPSCRNVFSASEEVRRQSPRAPLLTANAKSPFTYITCAACVTMPSAALTFVTCALMSSSCLRQTAALRLRRRPGPLNGVIRPSGPRNTVTPLPNPSHPTAA